MDNDLPGDEQNKEISAAELDADIDALLRLKPGSTAATELPLSSDRRQRVEAAADAARQAKQRRRSTPSQPPLQPDQNLTVSVDQPQLTLPTTQPVSPSPAPQRTSPSPAPQRASRTSYRLTPPAATHTETDTLDGLGITPVDQMKPAPAAGEAAVETAPPASGLPPKIKTGQTGPGAAADTPSTDHPAAPAATRRRSSLALNIPDPAQPVTSPEAPLNQRRRRNSAGGPAAAATDASSVLAAAVTAVDATEAAKPVGSRRGASDLPTAGPTRRRSSSTARSAADRLPRQNLAMLAENTNYRPAGMHDTSYRVRGGGFTQGRNPLMIAILTVVVAAALIGGIYGAWQLIQMLGNGGPATVSAAVTVQDTHTALASLPKLLNYLGSNADDAASQLNTDGTNVTVNDRKTSDNPDKTAAGKELVHLPGTATTADLDSYNSGEFNSFTVNDLETRLLGSWMLDISNGERGTYLQLKYVNLATDGVSEELHWLLDQQGLSGSGSVILKEGVDDSGNNFVEGYTVISPEQTVYWRVLGCAFSAYYHGSDARNIPTSAVYLKLRLANWDFVGVPANSDQTTTPAADSANTPQ